MSKCRSKVATDTIHGDQRGVREVGRQIRVLAHDLDDARQVGRGLLVDLQSAYRPIQKIRLEPRREQRHHLADDDHVGHEGIPQTPNECDCFVVVPVRALEQSDQRTGISGDAWHASFP